MTDNILYKKRFIWDRTKAHINIVKHHISFETASLVFHSPFAVVEYDDLNSINEERYNMVGSTNGSNCITVSFTQRDDLIRIFSAREADADEEEAYERNIRAHFGTR